MNNLNKAFTLIEMMIVVAIIIIISAVVITNLSSLRKQQSLKNTTEDIVTLLNEARLKTISSQNSTNYSVHFETNKAVLFTGRIYNQSDITNEQMLFDSYVEIHSPSGINLNGGGSNVAFERISGETSQNGTIVVSLISDASKQKMITISQTGLIKNN